MSVFRNNPNGSKPEGQEPAAPSRFGESLLSRPDLSPSAMDSVPGLPAEDPSRSNFPSFTERAAVDARPAPTPAEKCANVIAAGSRWSGSLNIDDSVRIEGQVQGEVNAKGTVHIADGARVEAKIRAGFVVVSGSFKGEVRCDERIELLPKSRFEGDIVTKAINIHEGATIDGNIQMTTAKADRSHEPEASEPAPIRSREPRTEKALS